MSDKLEFSYQGMAVGCFEEPVRSGQVRYMPYRGSGHYDMQMALRDGQCPRCATDEVTFEVRACPEYGVLELSTFITIV